MYIVSEMEVYVVNIQVVEQFNENDLVMKYLEILKRSGFASD